MGPSARHGDGQVAWNGGAEPWRRARRERRATVRAVDQAAGASAQPARHGCRGAGRGLRRRPRGRSSGTWTTLGSAGFPVYFERGYRLAAPALLPAVTLTVDQALALSLAARSAAPRAELATCPRPRGRRRRSSTQALAAQPPEDRPQRQLALALPVQDPRIEACTAALTEAIADQRTVRVTLASGSGAASRHPGGWTPTDSSRPPTAWSSWDTVTSAVDSCGYPLPACSPSPCSSVDFARCRRGFWSGICTRLQESAPQVHWIRLLARPPLAQALRKHPPVGTLMWERGPDGSVIFMIAAQRPGRVSPLDPLVRGCGRDPGAERLAPGGRADRPGRCDAVRCQTGPRRGQRGRSLFGGRKNRRADLRVPLPRLPAPREPPGSQHQQPGDPRLPSLRRDSTSSA